MSHTSKETIARFQTKRLQRQLDANQARAEGYDVPGPTAKRARVAPAIVLAAELVLFAFGFASGATIRQVSGESPPGCCAVSK